MGMYNEVFAPCPDCQCLCEMQIPQVVLGFGGFHLDRPETMSNLSLSDKHELADYVNNRAFNCDEHGSFQVRVKVGHKVGGYVI